MTPERLVVAHTKLRSWTAACLVAAGATSRDAAVTADALVAADMRGVDSHGVARLGRYVEGLRKGTIAASPVRKLVTDHAATAVLDADNGLGQPAAVEAMELAMQKASLYGVGVVGVCRSNHFGIAGYYARIASRGGQIGVAMTNASPQVAPTYGAEPMYGTNPIAVALPMEDTSPFLLDMATSIVPRGRLERMLWMNEAIPQGWAIDPAGNPATDGEMLVQGLKGRLGYALLPLGGDGEQFGGHKGFSLGLLVDLLCGPLTGSAWGRFVYGPSGANLGHILVAFSPEHFIGRDRFRAEAQALLGEIRSAKRTGGSERIFIPGEKEAEIERLRVTEGIPLQHGVFSKLLAIGESLGVPLPLGER